MARDDATYVVGGLILLGMLTKQSDGVAWGQGWHWPIPDLMLNGVKYPATISQGFHAGGVDMMYKRRAVSDLTDQFPPGVPDAQGAKATTMFFAPIGTPVLAAKDARVWAVQRIPIGWMVVLDHGAPWATAYHHLQTVNLEPHASGKRSGGAAPQIVKAGEQIGTMGHNPNTDPARGVVDGQKIRHLHFEAWYKGNSARSGQDPKSIVNSWGRSLWTL